MIGEKKRLISDNPAAKGMSRVLVLHEIDRAVEGAKANHARALTWLRRSGDHFDEHEACDLCLKESERFTRLIDEAYIDTWHKLNVLTEEFDDAPFTESVQLKDLGEWVIQAIEIRAKISLAKEEIYKVIQKDREYREEVERVAMDSIRVGKPGEELAPPRAKLRGNQSDDPKSSYFRFVNELASNLEKAASPA